VDRQQKITEWLGRLAPGEAFALAPASTDASFRRYFRATFADGRSLIVMDAPPEQEDVRPWLHVQQLFRAAGAHVPAVLAEDPNQGFLLLSDLGSTTYLAELSAANADCHYGAAIDSLIAIQLASRPHQLPPYDRQLLKRELDLFSDWYLARHVGLDLSREQQVELAAAFEKIMAVNLDEPTVYVHRDYHSRNLMITESGPGIIDFQDAVFGPISYDLASLFKDAYIAWEEERTLDWLIRYWQQARRAGLPVRADFADFHRDYEWMGVQRHAKVLGIFARLYYRDGKNSYLKDMPLVARYLRAACERYRDLTPLLKLLDLVAERQVATGLTL
jgi:aminoglycoside/choline kinase family phosphotransferase